MAYMENFDKKSGGEAKIEEYINRIKAGESKEEIIKDLPDVFKLKIEEGLQNDEKPKIEDKSDPNEFIEKRVRSEQEDKNKIEELRKEIGIKDKEEELKNRIEKYKISLPNLDEIIKNGGGQLEVFVNGEKVDFEQFTIGIDNESKTADVLFIRKKDQEKNSGIGVPIYIELGKSLLDKGIILNSSGAQYGPGSSIWQNLSKLGFTKKTNSVYSFVNNIENNVELKKGTRVSYEGREWKIADIIYHKDEIKDGEEKVIPVYNLERDDGYILQTGGVTEYIFREDFETL